MTAASSKGKMPTENSSVPWLSDPCKGFIEMFARIPEMSGLAFPEVKNTWDALFNGWKQILTAPLPNPFSATRGIEDLADLSKPWQESFVSLHKAWFSRLEKASAGNPSPEGRGGEAKNALDTWMKCCNELTGIWLRFADDQAKAFTQFWEALQTETKASDKKESYKVKEEKTP